jgi:glycerol-3-phosphate acyltransferase PlsY
LLLGNGFSIFLGWRGGKSVATMLGCVMFLYPFWLVGVMLATWLIVFAASKQVFMASISAAVAVTTAYWCVAARTGGTLLGFFLSLATVWLIWRHKSNLQQFWVRR